MSAEDISPATHPPVPKTAPLRVARDPRKDTADAELLAELEEYAEAEERLAESLSCKDERYTECIFQSQALSSVARREINLLGSHKNATE
jgi:hypothetical protein